MNPRALWKGAITLGPIRAPVKFYTAVRPKKIAFHLLHDQDSQRLSQRMYCPVENTPVDPEHIIRGFEVEKGEYVIVTDSELRALDPPPGRDVEVVEFVPAERIDQRYMDRTYWLGADGSGEALHALMEAMRRTSTAAVCTWTMRKKTYVGMLGPLRNSAAMVTLRSADDVIAAQSVLPQAQPAAPLDKREVQTARYLINTMSGTFEPGNYRDEFQGRLRELVEKKIAGEPIPAAPSPEPAEAPANLLEQLQLSLEEARKRKGHAPRRTRKAG